MCDLQYARQRPGVMKSKNKSRRRGIFQVTSGGVGPDEKLRPLSCRGAPRYWAWRKRPESPRAASDRTLLTRIAVARADRKKCYGSPYVTKALRAAGTICGRHQVARIMRQAGIKQVRLSARLWRGSDLSNRVSK